jgi:predicted AlkP superfamily phosphohydrolase/phosphomutase
VRPGAEARRLADELVRALQDEKDPATGRPVVTRAYRREEIYRGPCVEAAPDIVLGYHPGCRASWGTILGTYEREVFADNDDAWSGDHCMDVSGLDGVLLSNRKIVTDRPALIDLAPTILAAFDVDPPAGTEGRAVLAPA